MEHKHDTIYNKGSGVEVFCSVFIAKAGGYYTTPRRVRGERGGEGGKGGGEEERNEKEGRKGEKKEKRRK